MDEPKVIRHVFAFLLLGIIVAIGVYDIFALTSNGRFQTASSEIAEWSRAHPIIPFAFGVIVGHLFFPMK